MCSGSSVFPVGSVRHAVHLRGDYWSLSSPSRFARVGRDELDQFSAFRMARRIAPVSRFSARRLLAGMGLSARQYAAFRTACRKAGL